jgi:hypothetical protein
MSMHIPKEDVRNPFAAFPKIEDEIGQQFPLWEENGVISRY